MSRAEVLVQDIDRRRADVSPEAYGEAPLRDEWAGDRVRDAYEMELLHEFVEAGKPVLGICRGMQLINVAFGGSLYQLQRNHVRALLARRPDVPMPDIFSATDAGAGAGTNATTGATGAPVAELSLTR